ncbi:MAG: hypothetical protein EPO47_09020 [Rugosibacter sp.]|nr:MAG: hypothetical protein EPO60_07490 [Rugosibacter sp.]TBR08337.1 MAG: hypothetical protein EPO47_09020 [Rugosibacter sp.]
MNAPVLASSGTSTVAAPLHSSSSQIPPDQAVTAQSLPQPARSDSGAAVNAFFEKWGVPLGGMFLTGIIGYFSALLPLKDNINENKTEISVAKKEIEHVKEDVKRMEGDVGKIPALSTDIAVIRAKLEMTETRGKK